MIKSFISYLSISRGLSPRTLDEYGKDLQIFAEFCRQKKLNVLAVEESNIRDFLSHLKSGRKFHPRSLNRKISTLKGFYRFLTDEGKVKKSPLDRMKTVKTGKHFPKVFTRQEVKTLIDPQSENFSNRKYSMKFDSRLRDNAIFELFYATGMRIGEMNGLNLQDIDFTGGMIKVTGKGDKQRMVLMSGDAAESLKNWLQVRPEGNQAVFLNRRGERLSIRGIELLFKARLKQAGLAGKGSPHTMRHSFATHLLEGGADLVSIKELLGHESLSTTQIYCNLTMTKIKEVYAAAHGR